MRFLSEAGTDEAYVENVRAWLANPKLPQRRHLLAFLLLLLMAMALPALVTTGIGYLAAHKEDFDLLFAFGVAQVIGHPLVALGVCLLIVPRASRGLRLDRLMVRHYDEFKDRFGRTPVTTGSVTNGRESLVDDPVKLRIIKWFNRREYATRAKTDEECVAMARRSLKHGRWLALVFMAAAALDVAAIAILLRSAGLRPSRLSETAAQMGFVTGLLSGLLSGLLTWLAVFYAVEMLLTLRNPRVGRLVLKFHDALEGHTPCDDQ